MYQHIKNTPRINRLSLNSLSPGIPEGLRRRLGFLRLNGDVARDGGGLLMAAGGIFSRATIALFELVDVRALRIPRRVLLLWIISGVPLAATWLVLANPRLVSLVAPVIARVFTPAALVMLTLYLVVILIRIDTLFADRDFLLTFNLVLLAVMALNFVLRFWRLAGRTSGSVTIRHPGVCWACPSSPCSSIW